MRNPFSDDSIRKEKADERSVGIAYYVTRAPLFLAWMTWDFFTRWTASRPPRQLLLGIPALLLTLTAVSIGVSIWWHPPSLRYSEYLRKARQSAARTNFTNADLFYRKVLQLGRNDSRVFFESALVANALEQPARAKALMEEQSSRNFAPAQLWLAKFHLRDQNSVEADRFSNAAAELEKALRNSPGNVEVLSLLATVYMRQSQENQAVKLLEAAANQRPELLLNLASLYRIIGDDTNLKQTARRAADYFDTRLATGSLSGEEASRRQLSEALLQLDDFEQAARNLTINARNLKSQGIRELLARIYSLWATDSEREIQSDLAKLGTQLALLDQALRWAPQESVAIQELANTVDTALPDSLRDLLARGIAAPLIHLILGLQSDMDSTENDPELHFAQAQKLSPTTILTVGALGYHYASLDPPRKPLAEACLERLLSDTTMTANHHFLAGRTLVALERVEDGISHLSSASESDPENKGVHAILADAYHRQGNIDKAKEHFQKSRDTEF